MFEDLQPKSAEERGDTDPESILDKIVIFFYLAGALSALSAASQLWSLGLQFLPYLGPFFWLYIVVALLSFVTAPGLGRHKGWALYTGSLAAVLMLPRIPVGTIIGITLLIGLWRLRKASVLQS